MNIAILKWINEFVNIEKVLLRLSDIMENESCDIKTGLEHIFEIINKYTPKGPEVYRDDYSKVEYLYSAVRDEAWANPVLKSFTRNTPSWSFNKLFVALKFASTQDNRNIDSSNESEPSDAVQIVSNKNEHMNNNLSCDSKLPDPDICSQDCEPYDDHDTDHDTDPSYKSSEYKIVKQPNTAPKVYNSAENKKN